MVAIRYQGRQFPLCDGQSVLEALLAHGVPVPSACRSGVCQTCLMRAVGGVPPEASQRGLKASLRLQSYFLACVCHPTEDLEVSLPGADQAALPTTVKALEPLSEDIVQLTLECHAPLDYRPGQFIHLFPERTVGRSYSIASVPQLDKHIHLHVRHHPGGRVSGWIHHRLRPGDRVEIRGPAGDCFYVPGRPQQPMLLIGTGSGLAPLFGIVRDALAQGHTGPIRLYHGSRHRRGLYLVDELRQLAQQYPNFAYVPCLSGPEVPPGFAAGRAHAVALRDHPDLQGWRVFLCGHPEMVKVAKKAAFLARAAMADIHADPFHLGSAA